jgi:hypothetical protein
MNVPDGRIFLRKSGSGSDTIQSAITTGAQNSGSVILTGSITLAGPGNLLEISGDLMEFTGSFKVSGSVSINGPATITGSLDVTGGITGSFKGDGSQLTGIPTGDSFPFTGSALITGSLGITGSLNVTGGITGSLLGTASYASQALSSSFASTASFVQTAQTASYVLNAVSSSFASTASFVQTAQTASYVLNAVSSSFASTASFVNTLNQNVIINGAVTASSFTGSFVGDGSQLTGVGGGGTISSNLRGITIYDPTSAEDVTMYYTSGSLVINEVVGVLRGSASPSVTVTLRHNSDRNATGTAIVSAAALTSTTTATSLTIVGGSFTVPDNNFIWLETTAIGGTVNELFIQF